MVAALEETPSGVGAGLILSCGTRAIMSSDSCLFRCRELQVITDSRRDRYKLINVGIRGIQLDAYVLGRRE